MSNLNLTKKVTQVVKNEWDGVGELVAKAQAMEYIQKAVGKLQAENKQLRKALSVSECVLAYHLSVRTMCNDSYEDLRIALDTVRKALKS